MGAAHTRPLGARDRRFDCHGDRGRDWPRSPVGEGESTSTRLIQDLAAGRVPHRAATGIRRDAGDGAALRPPRSRHCYLAGRHTEGVPLLIDRSGRPAPLSDEDLRRWATTQAVFVSSEMGGLREERRALAGRLRALGFEVVLFEDLGGRDDDAQTAYLEGVARSDIYLGLVADRYGTMLPTGRSPTHEEYREARRLGLSIAVWVAAEGSGRQGDARDFISEVRTFHTTGMWETTDQLVASLEARLHELAAESESPWVKLGEVVARAQSVEDDGRTLTVTVASRDPQVLGALEGLRPDGWGRSSEIAVTLAHSSGRARVGEVRSRVLSSTARELVLSAEVAWADGRRPSLATGINGISFEEQVELGLRAGLLAEPLPERLGMLASMVDSSDPLAELDSLGLSQAIYAPVAGLLLVERLLGGGGASQVHETTVGPEHGARRPVRVVWTEPVWATNVTPGRREIEGWRTNAAGEAA